MELLILNFHENLQKDYFFSRKRMLLSMQISFCKYTRETNIRTTMYCMHYVLCIR